MGSLLSVRDLSLSVPTGHILQKQKLVLDRISFDIQAGVPTAYLGPNGAGKTSTFRILCGLCKPTGGELFFREKAIPHFCGIPSEGFGFMPEQPYFYRNLTPRELLTYLGGMPGKRPDLKQRIDGWAERLHFTQVLDQRLGLCSKGQVQRVGIAQALLHEPDFVLLDEPLSGLDPLGRELVKDILSAEIKRGATLLFSSHVLSDVESLCQQIIVLHRGRTIYQGHIDTLLNEESQWQTRIKGPLFLLEGFKENDRAQKADGTWVMHCRSVELRNQCIQFILGSSEHELLSVESSKKTLEQAFVSLLQSDSLS